MFILFYIHPEILVINFAYLSENVIYIVNLRAKSTD